MHVCPFRDRACEANCALCKDSDDDDDLRDHDAQHHDLQVGDNVPQRLLHGASPSSGWRGFHLWVGPQVKTPPEGEVFENGQAIALASATTWERTKIRTMSFRSVTTFNRASFMTVSSKKNGETTPPGREISPGGERTTA